MRSLTAADGDDFPWLIDEVVPGVATQGDDLAIGFEPRLDNQFSRMNCQMFSTGLSSRDRGGIGKMVMLVGTTRLLVVCHPA